MKEFFASNQMRTINEDSERTTFQNSKNSSNIDITIVNKMLATIKNWEISEDESCSDRKIITFNLNFAYNKSEKK
jgi:hypothetical protein